MMTSSSSLGSRKRKSSDSVSDGDTSTGGAVKGSADSASGVARRRLNLSDAGGEGGGGVSGGLNKEHLSGLVSGLVERGHVSMSIMINFFVWVVPR